MTEKLFGWSKRILVFDLERKEAKEWRYPGEMARDFIGGRGFAVKILWDQLEPGTDPLSPSNLLILAVGPLTGLMGPCMGKMVIASKSPLTGGYGDGNIGTKAAVALRMAGWDAIVIKGKAEKPSILVVEDDKARLEPAEDLWGLDTFTAYDKLEERFGKNAGILLIGPGGENLVRYATVVSQKGRSGGRPGMGAVMGSKKLKAIVIKGTKKPELSDPDTYMKIAREAIESVRKSDGYSAWLRQGTMATVAWAQKNSVLPTFNYREGVFDGWETISGDYMEKIRVRTRSCPLCVMPCGHVVRDEEGKESEVDYENIAMLGSNIGVSRLEEAAMLNRMADELGIDTISLGNVLGYATEAAERKKLDIDISWGETKKYVELVKSIARREGIGDLLAEGVKRISERIGETSYAMHVKGLEISAYDCHAAPGMALAYATSPIGAHHKDAWVISWEVAHGRFSYGREKAEKVIEMQRWRGGLFESIVACRLPVIELGLSLEYYAKLFNAATGLSYTLNDIYTVADRIYALIRMFWIREMNGWSIEMDMPPERWFKEPLTRGPLKGAKLDKDKFLQLLRAYYEIRGWSSNGVPKPETLERLGLSDAIPLAKKFAE